MKKLICVMITLSLAISVYSREVKGLSCSFDIPENVKFLPKDGYDSYNFIWGDVLKPSMLTMVATEIPISESMADMMADTLSMTLEKELARRGVTEDILKEKQSITIGEFKGIQLFFTIKTPQKDHLYLYFLFLSDGKNSWTVQFRSFNDIDYNRAIAIIKSIKITGKLKGVQVADSVVTKKTSVDFNIPHDAPSSLVYYKSIYEFYKRWILIPHKKSLPNDRVNRYIDEVLKYSSMLPERQDLTKLLRQGKEISEAFPDDIAVAFAYGFSLYQNKQYNDAARIMNSHFNEVKKERPISNIFSYLYTTVLWNTFYKLNRRSNQQWSTSLSCMRTAIEAGEVSDADSRVLYHLLSYYSYNCSSLINIFKKKGNEFVWLLKIMNGKQEVTEAWDARGNGCASDVTGEGWKGFYFHLEQARQLLSAAWKMHPERPEAAALMITVAMGGGSRPGETAIFWFNRAVKAEIDFYLPYVKLLWALRPRWGGSYELMYEMGKRCVDADRFDTPLSERFIWTLFSIAQDKVGAFRFSVFRKEETKQLCDKLFENRLATNPGPELRERLIAFRVLCELYGGRYREASEHIKELDQDFNFKRLFVYHDTGRTRTQLETEIRAGLTDSEKMNEAYELFYSGDLEGAKGKLLEVLDEVASEDVSVRQYIINEIGLLMLNRYMKYTHLNTRDILALSYSIMENKEDIFEYLLSLGADVNAVTVLSHSAPIRTAVIFDRIKMLKRVLEEGADVNIRNKILATPLHYAASSAEKVETVKLLLENGADMNLKTKYGDLPLHWLKRNNSDMVFTYFLDQVQDIDAPGAKGYSLLCYEAERGNLKRVKLLLKKGADINFQDTYGNTPLLIAYRNGKKNMVKYLIEQGSDITLKNKRNQSYSSITAKKKKHHKEGGKK